MFGLDSLFTGVSSGLTGDDGISASPVSSTAGGANVVNFGSKDKSFMWVALAGVAVALVYIIRK